MGETGFDSFNGVVVGGIKLLELLRQHFDLLRGDVPQICFLTAPKEKKIKNAKIGVKREIK